MSTKPARARGRGGGRAGARQDRTERNEHYRIQLNIKYLRFARVCPSACEARVCESVPKASGIELYFLFMFTFFIVLGLACLVALLWYQRRHGLDPASSATEPFREDTPLSRRPHPDAF